MGRKKTGAIPTAPPKEPQKMVIDMTKAELAKAYHVPSFRTGRHMTDKDRPRKKNWKKEYAKGKESDPYGKYGCDFLLYKRQAFGYAGSVRKAYYVTDALLILDISTC